DRSRHSADVKRLALAQAEDLRGRMRAMEEMAGTIETLAACCHGDDRPDCPILDNLSGKAPG
nr:Cu(I)-responsive transcriptional regulator [Paracoccaceae bacterium]